jgi:hypothetical protein
MRDTLAWLGWGDAGAGDGQGGLQTEAHLAALQAGSTRRRKQASPPAAPTGSPDGWLCPEICLALTLLAEEQAAAVAGLSDK